MQEMEGRERISEYMYMHVHVITVFHELLSDQHRRRNSSLVGGAKLNHGRLCKAWLPPQPTLQVLQHQQKCKCAIDSKGGITLRRTLLVSFQHFPRELDGVRM